jgi:hypothetical protein
VVAAKNGLVIARNEFKASGGAGHTFTLDADTRKSLEDLKPDFDANDKLLGDAIEKLKGLSQ